MVDDTRRPDVPLFLENKDDHLRRISQRVNVSLSTDGAVPMLGPLPLVSYLAADEPDATLWEGAIIFVSDEDTVKFSDGTSWIDVGGGGGGEVNDLTAAVTWDNIPDANVPQSAVTQHVAAIDHDALLNFAVGEHFTQAAISIPLSQISDVTATAAEVNLLDLAGLTAGWVLSADTATTASWKAAAGGLPAGTTNYTLAYDGAAWVSNGNVRNPQNGLLQVWGTDNLKSTAVDIEFYQLDGTRRGHFGPGNQNSAWSWINEDPGEDSSIRNRVAADTSTYTSFITNADDETQIRGKQGVWVYYNTTFTAQFNTTATGSLALRQGYNGRDDVNDFERVLTDGQQDWFAATAFYKFETSTVMGDPGLGDMRMDSATMSSVTQMAFDQFSHIETTDISWLWNTLSPGDTIILRCDNDIDFYWVGTVDGVTDNTGWFLLDVTHRHSNAVGITNDLMNVTIQYTGNIGGANTTTWSSGGGTTFAASSSSNYQSGATQTFESGAILEIEEAGSMADPSAGHMRVWARDDTPNVLMVTDDAGDDFFVGGNDANVGLTADVGSAQGNGVITATFNVYSTVANAGDAATLPATFPVSTAIYIKNDGANSMDVFPASGDDAGAGTNTAVAVAAGAGTLFLATAADATWTQMYVG